MRETTNWKAFLEKWLHFFIIIGVFAGGLLGSFLVYIFQGQFLYEVFAGSVVATVILIIFQLVKMMRKKDKLPETDERIIHNVTHFFAYTSHITLTIMIIVLAAFTLLGHESVPIWYLWIFFFAYIGITGIGAIIIRRR